MQGFLRFLQTVSQLLSTFTRLMNNAKSAKKHIDEFKPKKDDHHDKGAA